MHGTQADARLFGEFTLRDVGGFVDQVHDPKVGVGVLGLGFSIHLIYVLVTLPPYRVHRSIEKIKHLSLCSILNKFIVTLNSRFSNTYMLLKLKIISIWYW